MSADPKTQISVRVKNKNLEKIDEFAAEDERSRSYHVDKALEEYISRRPAKPKRKGVSSVPASA